MHEQERESVMEYVKGLSGRNLKIGYDKRIIIEHMDISIPNNKVSVILGGNGCGKSTLLKTLSRLIKPIEGNIYLDGKEIHSIPTKQLAQNLGLLPQSSLVPDGIKVSDLVARGRYPYQKIFGGMTKEDYKAVMEAMELMGITELMERNVEELSGGQRQRVWIAMALAQQTDILLLDEPTTFLDITYQIEILDLLLELNRKRNTTIVMVLHDINLSARYADYLFALKKGQLIKQGTPEEVITEEMMSQIFDLQCMVIKDPVSDSPFIIPKGKFHQ